MFVLNKERQIINGLAIGVLENIGLSSPTGRQIDILEESLLEYLQYMGMAILILDHSGKDHPMKKQVKQVFKKLRSLTHEFEGEFSEQSDCC